MITIDFQIFSNRESLYNNYAFVHTTDNTWYIYGLMVPFQKAICDLRDLQSTTALNMKNICLLSMWSMGQIVIVFESLDARISV